MKKEFESLKSYIAANNARIELNVAVLADKATEIAKAKKVFDEALKAFNEDVTVKQYEDLIAFSEAAMYNPVLEAIKQGSIETYRGTQDKTSKEFEFKAKMTPIDLLELDTVFKKSTLDDALKTKGIFNNADWKYWVEALNHAVYNSKKEAFGIERVSDKLNKWVISETAKVLELANLDSITNQTKAMQSIVDAIIFTAYIDAKGKETEKNAYKVESRHTRALLENYTKWSNQSMNGIVFATDKTFRQMLMRVLFLIINKKEMEAE